MSEELALSDADRAAVSKSFGDYLFVAVIDADVTDKKKPTIMGVPDVVAHATFFRDGEKVQVLTEVNPEVARLAPKLVYLLRASMGQLGQGLHLLPLSNVSSGGKPIVTASSPGQLKLEFRFTDSGPVHEVRWHAPLTAVVGPKKCPKDGEEMDASWSYCPWHGVPLATPLQKPKP